MYHGEVNVNQEDLQPFLAAAEELRIKGLSQVHNIRISHFSSLNLFRFFPLESSILFLN
jgi:hypothetical protein